MLSLINLQLKLLSKATMKRTIFSVLTAALAASALFVSCEPLEPSTREDTFYRIASVSYKDGDASLLLDYTGESYKFSNFSTKSDMNRFGVQNGDRVIAEITMTAVGTVTNNTLTLNRVIKYPRYALSESRPADSLNYGFRFCSLNLVSVIYPTAWTQGHVLSIAPEYYSSHKGVKPAFKLYPSKVVGDTLMLNLFCDMPDTLTVWDTEQAFVNFDISTLRDQVSDLAEQNHRDSLLTQLEATGKDRINVKVTAPTFMRVKMFKTSGEVIEIKLDNYLIPTVTVSLPFDF